MRPPTAKKAPKAAPPPLPIEKRCIDLVLDIEAASKQPERNHEVWKAVRYVRERLAQTALTL